MVRTKIKIIDLLNKIANGEENINVETKYDSDDWEKDDFLLSLYKEFEHKNNYEIVEFLNDYVEIIEESKKIEKITIREKTLGFPSGEWTARNMDKAFAIKINELIDEIKNLKEK